MVLSNVFGVGVKGELERGDDPNGELGLRPELGVVKPGVGSCRGESFIDEDRVGVHIVRLGDEVERTGEAGITSGVKGGLGCFVEADTLDVSLAGGPFWR
jgi:hypothetical protein